VGKSSTGDRTRARDDRRAPDAVHVWWIDLERIEEPDWHVLSPEERARAARFRQPGDRRRWSQARTALRQILARYSSAPPEALRFAPGPWGKPALVGGAALRFSLSHAGPRAALAVARERDVGIDLEPLAPHLDRDLASLIAVGCSPAETARLLALPPDARLEAFLACWTMKEAYLKALGVGLSRDPRAIETETTSGGRVVVRDPLAVEGPPAWTLRRLDAGPGWLAALAVADAAPRVEVFGWPE
jgi:4'-phosphopantetheinyl transferase